MSHTCKHRLTVRCDEGGDSEGGAVLVLDFSLWFGGFLGFTRTTTSFFSYLASWATAETAVV